MDSRYLRNPSGLAPTSNFPRRSRPDWLSEDIPKASGLPTVVIRQEPINRNVDIPRFLPPVSFNPIRQGPMNVPSSRQVPMSVPLIRQPVESLLLSEARLPRSPKPFEPTTLEAEFLVRHRLSSSDLIRLTDLVGHVKSIFPIDQIQLVGPFADGTASRHNTKCITFACTCELVWRVFPSEFSIIEESHNMILVRFYTEVIRIIKNPVLIKRALFVKMYTHIVEPRVGIAVVLIMDRLHEKFWTKIFWDHLDYIIFVIVFKTLSSRRVIPDLVSEKLNDGRMESDRAIWSSNLEDSKKIRMKWRKTGMCVSARMSVAEIMAAFLDQVRSEMFLSVKCPINGQIVLENTELYEFFCSTDSFRID